TCIVLFSVSLHDALPISSALRAPLTWAARWLLAASRRRRDHAGDRAEDSPGWAAEPAGHSTHAEVYRHAQHGEPWGDGARTCVRSEEHTSELQSRENLVC